MDRHYVGPHMWAILFVLSVAASVLSPEEVPEHRLRAYRSQTKEAKVFVSNRFTAIRQME